MRGRSWWVMVVDGLASCSRVVDRVVCWYLAPVWCRGSLWSAVRRTTWLAKKRRSR